MKKIAWTMTCLLGAVMYTATAQVANNKGIRFFEGSWKALLDTAQKLQKPIFIDVYTSWCAPCKLMDRTVFTADVVSETYNAGFINYRLDAEKGEGIDIARKYNVKAYPTFLFVNSSGYLIHKRVGEQEAAPFVATGKAALLIAAQKDNLAALEERFDAGDYDTAFLHVYLARLKQEDMDNSKVLDAYFNQLSYARLGREETMVFLGQYLMSMQTAALGYFLDHYDALSDATKNKVAGNMYRMCNNGISKGLESNNVMVVKTLLQLMDKLPGLSEEIRYRNNRLWLAYYDKVRNNKQVIATGYALTAGLMNISTDSMRQIDARVYAQIMKPYLTGEKDSTVIPGFSEERKLVEHTYTQQICSNFYTVIQAFVKLPDTERKALLDAYIWTNTIARLDAGNKVFSVLLKQLDKRCRDAGILMN